MRAFFGWVSYISVCIITHAGLELTIQCVESRANSNVHLNGRTAHGTANIVISADRIRQLQDRELQTLHPSSNYSQSVAMARRRVKLRNTGLCESNSKTFVTCVQT